MEILQHGTDRQMTELMTDSKYLCKEGQQLRIMLPHCRSTFTHKAKAFLYHNNSQPEAADMAHSEEHLLLLQRTWGQFPAPTWQLTATDVVH